MSPSATIPSPYASSILCSYPYAYCTFPYAPPYLSLFSDLILLVYKSSVLHPCTSVCISTKSPILLLEVPSRSYTHLCTSVPLSLWNQGQRTSARVWHTSLCQVLIKSPSSYLHWTSGPPLFSSPNLYHFLHWTWAWRTWTWREPMKLMLPMRSWFCMNLTKEILTLMSPSRWMDYHPFLHSSLVNQENHQSQRSMTK